MQVQDAMAKTITVASPSDPIKRVAQMMRQVDAGFIPVVEGGALLGVVTDRDIVIRGLADGHDRIGEEPAERFMTPSPATVEAGASLEEAARIMDEREIRRLPVMQDGKLVGVLSHGNLVQAARSEGPADRATLGVTRGA